MIHPLPTTVLLLLAEPPRPPRISEDTEPVSAALRRARGAGRRARLAEALDQAQRFGAVAKSLVER